MAAAAFNAENLVNFVDLPLDLEHESHTSGRNSWRGGVNMRGGRRRLGWNH
eukprot:SAG11_NODE_32941_length_280_cov_0.569061_1_plen_50_part_01